VGGRGWGGEGGVVYREGEGRRRGRGGWGEGEGVKGGGVHRGGWGVGEVGGKRGHCCTGLVAENEGRRRVQSGGGGDVRAGGDTSVAGEQEGKWRG